MKEKTTKYAVLRISGKQYLVHEGDKILVEGIKTEKIGIETLMFVDGGKVEVGRPVISKSIVEYKILGEEKGEKIDVLKYKAKSRYRKHIGHRSKYTQVLITKI